MVLLKLVTGI